jgi:hypothetical protein
MAELLYRNIDPNLLFQLERILKKFNIVNFEKKGKEQIGLREINLMAKNYLLENIILEIIAQENIEKFRPITIDGKLAIPNQDNFGKVIGISYENLYRGRSGKVLNRGIISKPEWKWNKGENIFIDSNANFTNQFMPDLYFSQIIGTTINPDAIYINLQLPILL